MHSRRVTCGVLALVVLAGGATGSAGAASPVAVSGTLTELIAALPLTPALTAGYARKLFVDPRTAAAKDWRGCNRKGRLLIARAESAPRVYSRCTLRGGAWTLDSGATALDSSQIEMIAVIDTPTAWAHGAYGWQDAQRRAFANASMAPSARVAWSLTSTGTPTAPRSVLASVLAGSPGAMCRELGLVVKDLVSWGLSVDSATQRTLLRHAVACPDVELDVGLANTKTRVPPVGANNPYSAARNSAALSGSQSVLDALPGPVISSELFGIHLPPAQGLNPPVRHGYVRLWDSDVGWNAIQPKSGTFVWKTLDAVIEAAEASGAKVDYVFGPTPSWAGDLSTDPPRRLSDFRRFVEALVDRYGDRIDAFEVWNEPNLQSYYTGTSQEMVDMTRVVASAVRSARVHTRVLAASTTTRTTGSFYNFYSQYLAGLRRAGWPVDGFSFHSYPRASGLPADRIAAVTMFKGMLVLAGAPKLPIYETEINYGLAGQDEPHREIGGPSARGYLAQTFIDAVRSGVRSVHWYLWTRNDYPLLGIQLNSSTPDNVAAWNWTYERLVGASLLSCADEGAASICAFTRAGHDFALAYSSSGEAASLSVPTALTTACTMRGSCSAIEGSTVTVGIEPILLQ